MVQQVEGLRTELELTFTSDRARTEQGGVEVKIAIGPKGISSRRAIRVARRNRVCGCVEPLRRLLGTSGVTDQIHVLIAAVPRVGNVAADDRRERSAGMCSKDIVDLPVPQNVIEGAVACRKFLPSPQGHLVKGTQGKHICQ